MSYHLRTRKPSRQPKSDPGARWLLGTQQPGSAGAASLEPFAPSASCSAEVTGNSYYTVVFAYANAKRRKLSTDSGPGAVTEAQDDNEWCPADSPLGDSLRGCDLEVGV